MEMGVGWLVEVVEPLESRQKGSDAGGESTLSHASDGRPYIYIYEVQDELLQGRE